jgi:uncharacterized protein YkwD
LVIAIYCVTPLVYAEVTETAPNDSEKNALVNFAADVTPVALWEIEEAIIERTNSERIRLGLEPLEVCSNLIQSARVHTVWMARSQNLAHGRGVAENIAWGQETPHEAVQSWMNSPGHRANMLNPGHRRIGVAAYEAADGRIYWCQQFKS